MNAEKYNLDRIYFGGYFIRGKWILYFLILPISFMMAGLFQGTRQQWPHYHMPYGSGARGRSGPCFYDTRDFCKWDLSVRDGNESAER